MNFDWLSPFSVGEILRGKEILEALRTASGDSVSEYNYHEYVIKNSSLKKGIKYYDIALRIYMGAVLKRHALEKPSTKIGVGNCTSHFDFCVKGCPPVESQIYEELKKYITG